MSLDLTNYCMLRRQERIPLSCACRPHHPQVRGQVTGGVHRLADCGSEGPCLFDIPRLWAIRVRLAEFYQHLQMSPSGPWARYEPAAVNERWRRDACHA